MVYVHTFTIKSTIHVGKYIIQGGMGNVFVLAIGLTDASKMFPVVGLAVRFHHIGFIVLSPLGPSNMCFPLFLAIL